MWWRSAATEQLFSVFPAGLMIVDARGRIETVNPWIEQLSGYEREQLVGQSVELLVPERHRERHRGHRQRYGREPSVRNMASGLVLTLLRRDGTELPVDIGLAPATSQDMGEGHEPATVVVIRDAEDRSRIEGALHRRAAEQTSFARLAVDGMVATDIDKYLETVAQELSRVLNCDWCAVLEIVSRAETVRLRTGVGAVPMSPWEITIDELGPVAHSLATGEAVRVGDIENDARFDPPDWLKGSGLRSSISAAIPGRDGPFGAVWVRSRTREAWSTGDQEFVAATAQIVGVTLGRLAAEDEAEDQRARLSRFAERSNDLIFRHQLTPERGCLFVNRAVLRLLGYSVEACERDPDLLSDVLGLDELGLDDPGADPADAQTLRHVVRARHADGSDRWLDLQLLWLTEGEALVVEGIGRDLTERIQREQNLEHLLDEQRRDSVRLRELDHTKNAFLQAVSHELRTPLTVISGLSETLVERDEQLDDSDREAMIERLAINAARLDRLLGDLLDLDRLARGIIAPRRRRVALDTLVARCLDTIEFGEKQLATELQPIAAEVDPAMVERAVENLVGNALKHTPPGTDIRVRTYAEGEDALIEVSDSGEGVPQELREAVFLPFEQGPTAPSHRPGSGIGLALAARFVELHDGSIELADGPDGGAAFQIRIPLATASDHPQGERTAL
ncbi:MAG: PAS domain S-box protein [Nitriliruptoraceae bacterium]